MESCQLDLDELCDQYSSNIGVVIVGHIFLGNSIFELDAACHSEFCTCLRYSRVGKAVFTVPLLLALCRQSMRFQLIREGDAL